MSGSHLPMVVGLAPYLPERGSQHVVVGHSEQHATSSRPFVVHVAPFDQDLCLLSEVATSSSKLLADATQHVMSSQVSEEIKRLKDAKKCTDAEIVEYLQSQLRISLNIDDAVRLMSCWQAAREELANNQFALAGLFNQVDDDHNSALLFSAKKGSLECMKFCFYKMGQSLNDRNRLGEDILRVAKQSTTCLKLIVKLVEEANEHGVYKTLKKKSNAC